MRALKFLESDIEYLVALNIEEISDKKQFLVMQQLGDEIVDPDEALSYYKGCQLIVEPGGCHDFEGFAAHVQPLVNFLFDAEDQ